MGKQLGVRQSRWWPLDREVHIVMDRSLLPRERATLIRKTAEGRVLVAVRWMGKTILRTTDMPRDD